MKNENRLVPDFRTETIEEITETYTPEGGAEQTATYKIGTAHPIIGGILDKFTWIRTHAAAVCWNAMDEQIAQLNGKLSNPYQMIFMIGEDNINDANALPMNSCGYTYPSSLNAPTNEGSILIFTFGTDESYKAQIAITVSNAVYTRRRNDAVWTAWRAL